MVNCSKFESSKKTKTMLRHPFSEICCSLMTMLLNVLSKADMQRCVDMFSRACTHFGITVSTKKTEVLHQPAPGKLYVEPKITGNGQRLNQVNRFIFLGSALRTLTECHRRSRSVHPFCLSQLRLLHTIPKSSNRRSIITQTKLSSGAPYAALCI